jgi:hypothetical protein
MPSRLNGTRSGRLPGEVIGHMMRRSPIHLSLVLLLTILLGVQLTGLPCVYDTATTHVAVFSTQDASSCVGQQSQGLDGCPCHSHFVSIQWNCPQPESIATPLALKAPPLLAPLLAPSLFRPPVAI